MHILVQYPSTYLSTEEVIIRASCKHRTLAEALQSKYSLAYKVY